MHLLYPYIILAIIPLVWIWWIFFREKIGYSFPNKLMKKHTQTPKYLILIWSIRVSMIFLTFLLLAVPSMEVIESIPITPGKNITLILDLSKSMLADDISPNRLEGAKEVLMSFLSEESVDRYGLVVFAGKAFTLSPLTTDRPALMNIIKNISTDTIRQYLPGISGTNIGDALLLASLLESSATGAKTVILITDGRANTGIDPLVAARALRAKNTTVYTIGIGASSGSILSYLDASGVRQYFYDERGEKLRADIDRDMLEQIATITGGGFFLASDTQIFTHIFEDLSHTLMTPIEYRDHLRYFSLSLPVLFLLGILALIHAFLVYLMRK